MKKWTQRKQETLPNRWDEPLDILAKIRGIDDPYRFLNPTSEELFDPFLLKNIRTASEMIIEAIKKGKRIVVSYDPDADGIMSATIMIRYLKSYTQNVDFIYGERGDGHGIKEMITEIQLKEDDLTLAPARYHLNNENVDKIKQADLLILVDSSSSDTEACKFIRELDTDIVILDHHGIEQHNPYAVIVNPQQRGCKYPNKHLSAAGVVFKTIQVVEEMMGEGKVNPFNFIDLVAVGMYADVMRVDVHENRYLIMQGMRNMKNTGLVRILKSGKVDLFKVNSASIAFTISPLINGVCRMDRIKLAIDMLLEDDDKVCQKIQREMKKVNESRKERQKLITEQYQTQVDDTKKILIVVDEQSSKGFNGIVAQQLSDKYKRPVIVGRRHGGEISGSFRSYGDFPMRTFLKAFGDITAVGHEPAGGVSFKEDKLEELQEYIEAHAKSLDEMEPTIEYDVELTPRMVPDYIKPIEQFNLLYGNGFEKVVVKVSGLSIDEVNIIGAKAETCKIKTFDGLELIKFRVPETYAEELEVFDDVSVIGQLQVNEFFNFKTKVKTITNQVILEDYKKY